jgi:uncharacterized protein DUF3631/uncharacterized protein DUF3854
VNLQASDLEMFARLRIPIELLERASIARVTDREAREDYGIRGGGDMAGVAFPYFDPETMSNGRRRNYVRIRRDFPEHEDGRPKKKYVAPYGDRKHLYFPPTPELFPDVTIPIVLVEAEKSALALTAWAGRVGRKILPLAIGGCYGWRGKVGIKETATGERVPDHDAIPDLNICRDGRKTYVLLDANCGSNPKVQQARAALVRQLRKQGAAVAILDLPSGDGINGPDDHIGVMGDEAMTALFEGAGEGENVLNEIVSFLRRYVILSEAQAAAIALWCAHTYTFKSAAWSPYLNVTSAAPECGKSLLLETLEFLVRKPWKVDGASPAVLFRKIELDQPTLLFDELDTTFRGDKETAQAIRQVLNAGAKYNGTVARCVGEHHTPKDFRVFSPKVLAGIGDLPPTVSSRSLPITLGRKLATEKVAYLDHGDLAIKSRAAELRNRVSDWIEKRGEGLRHITPDFPEQLTDRQKDGARILLAIADAAGGEWPAKSRTVICELYGSRPVEDQSIGIQLLRDARTIFDETEAEKITSGDFVENLTKIETSPWAEWNRGKPMTAVGLSRLLKPFKIFPRKIRIGDATLQGYERSSFADAWDRYLARTAPTSRTPGFETEHAEQANVYAAETHFSKTEQDASVPSAKSEESSVFMRVVPDVPDQKGGKGMYDDLELPCHAHGRHRQWWVKMLPDGGEMTCGKCCPEPKDGTA